MKTLILGLGNPLVSDDSVGLRVAANEDILLIGIEADDVVTFSEECTPAVRDAVPRAVREVIKALDDE